VGVYVTTISILIVRVCINEILMNYV